MKTVLSAVFLLLSSVTYSQYYYNDLKSTQAMGERMKGYVQNKVSTITATGFDAQNVKTSDFNEWQEVDAAGYLLKITTRNGQVITRQWYRFDRQFNLLTQVDSSGDVKSTTTYTYDAGQRLVTIKTTSNDSLIDFKETDEHQWHYNAAGQPVSMLRIVNGKDSSEYRFTTDEKGNVADEQLFRRGVGIDPVYYYYDDNNRLTDIVRYNKRLKKLLPDFMFEYDAQNRVSQRITTLSTINPDYLIWRYVYNENGLKVKEILLDKKKERTGSIEYSYQ